MSLLMRNAKQLWKELTLYRVIRQNLSKSQMYLSFDLAMPLPDFYSAALPPRVGNDICTSNTALNSKEQKHSKCPPLGNELHKL